MFIHFSIETPELSPTPPHLTSLLSLTVCFCSGRSVSTFIGNIEKSRWEHFDINHRWHFVDARNNRGWLRRENFYGVPKPVSHVSFLLIPTSFHLTSPHCHIMYRIETLFVYCNCQIEVFRLRAVKILNTTLYQLHGDNPIHDRFNSGSSVTTLSQLNPNMSQLNPILTQLNPNLSQLNPILTQLNSNLSQLNPNLSQLNPNLSQLNPNLSQLNPIHDRWVWEFRQGLRSLHLKHTEKRTLTSSLSHKKRRYIKTYLSTLLVLGSQDSSSRVTRAVCQGVRLCVTSQTDNGPFLIIKSIHHQVSQHWRLCSARKSCLIWSRCLHWRTEVNPCDKIRSSRLTSTNFLFFLSLSPFFLCFSSRSLHFIQTNQDELVVMEAFEFLGSIIDNDDFHLDYRKQVMSQLVPGLGTLHPSALPFSRFRFHHLKYLLPLFSSLFDRKDGLFRGTVESRTRRCTGVWIRFSVALLHLAFQHISHLLSLLL